MPDPKLVLARTDEAQVRRNYVDLSVLKMIALHLPDGITECGVALSLGPLGIGEKETEDSCKRLLGSGWLEERG